VLDLLLYTQVLEDILLKSKLSSKSQITVPKKICKILDIEPGEDILYDIVEDTVRIRKARPIDLDWIRSQESHLTEWTDDLDNDL
jgi:antitoxin PrlF